MTKVVLVASEWYPLFEPKETESHTVSSEIKYQDVHELSSRLLKILACARYHRHLQPF